MPADRILAIDQGTTSSRAVLYDVRTFEERGSAGQELTQHYPQPGWVEHDPEEIWSSVAKVVTEALQSSGTDPARIAAIGITNQRETVVLWDRASSRPIARAIVWQDRRTADFCKAHRGDRPWLQERTGLILDPYFSGTKVRWFLEQDPVLRQAAQGGTIACGTIDTFLLWRLTGGAVHATDVTNASRTLLLDLRRLSWDDELLRYFDVPAAILPDVRPSVADFGVTRGLSFLPDGIPIRGIAGDQQAALFGQQAFAEGDAKCTYGTGAFFLLNIGSTPVISRHQLITTPAAITSSGPRYALEGSVFIAGAAVQWLRDGLKMFPRSADVEALALQARADEDVLFVPAFVGLGAPHWAPEARGAIFGLQRSTTSADIARAALEGVAFQVADLMEAAARDTNKPLTSLRVDGGMARNPLFLQMQANLLGIPVLVSGESEATARGAAFLAALGVGCVANEVALAQIPFTWSHYRPQLPDADRTRRRERWQQAVRAVLSMDSSSSM